MQYHILRPHEALNKVYLHLKTSHAEMEVFKKNLRNLLDNINQNEEHANNHLHNFLKSIYYVKYGVSTRGKTNLVIHSGPTTKFKPGVLLEVKRPTNTADMTASDNLNANAMHELLLFYMRERVQNMNHDLRHLVVTSVLEWFIFDALEFDRLFYRNKELKQAYTEWQEGRKASTSIDFFYNKIAKPLIVQLSEQIKFTYFNLQDYVKPLHNATYEGEAELELLYKMLSPGHLLKEYLPAEETGENSSPVCYAHVKGLREGFE